jgi:hypothetical protein
MVVFAQLPVQLGSFNISAWYRTRTGADRAATGPTDCLTRADDRPLHRGALRDGAQRNTDESILATRKPADDHFAPHSRGPYPVFGLR